MFNNKKDKEKIQVLQAEIKRLKEEKDKKISISFLMEEDIPEDPVQYKRYLGDIALFYGSVFKQKLKHFIGMQMEYLSQIGRTEKEAEVIKANINAFRLIDEWMEKKTNQHFGVLEEMRKNFKDEKEFISNFRKTYGENKNN